MKKIWLIFKKDISLELAGLRIVPVVLVMGLLIVLIFAYLLGQSAQSVDISVGILWTAFLFTGIVAIEKCFDSESHNAAISGLRQLLPSMSAVFFGKLLWVLFLLYIVEIWVGAVYIILFDANLYLYAGRLLIIASLFNIGFAALGVLFAGLTCQCRGKGFLLVIILLPLLIAPTLAAVAAAVSVLNGADATGISRWLKFLAGFDILFGSLSALLFEKAMEQ